MAAINVEIISKELIKPSSPTPDHLRIYKRSCLDQVAPTLHVPFIFFYPSDSPQNTRTYSQSLKQSLSETLTKFYPLAGRINNDSVSVDCNDTGVLFIEARVDVEFSQVLQNPNEDELHKFLPINPLHYENLELVAVQLNIFDGGSLVVSVCVSHRVADGLSMITFIRSWSSQALGHPELIKTPDFESGHKLLPPVDLSGFRRDHTALQEPVVSRRLVFDKTKISNLKKLMSDGKFTPTRVEAVSAFIWKQLIKSSQAKNVGNDDKLYIGGHSVNLRGRANPPLGEEAFGNIWTAASAVSAGGDDQVAEFRDAFKKIDGDYVKGLEDGDSYVNYIKKSTAEAAAKGGNIESVFFTSWCSFPLYEVDFGFGKPAWVCMPPITEKNLGVLISSKDGDGIEIWFGAVAADMEALEARIKLI